MHRLRLFVAEDNDSDIQWLKQVLDEMGISYDLFVATDGEQALEFLLKRGPYAQAPDADLIVLDLNLPKIKGIDILKSVPHPERLPVCIVSGSEEEREVLRKAFGIRRVAYLRKPVDHNRILNTFRAYDHLRPVAEELSAKATGVRHKRAS